MCVTGLCQCSGDLYNSIGNVLRGWWVVLRWRVILPLGILQSIFCGLCECSIGLVSFGWWLLLLSWMVVVDIVAG